MTEETKGAAGPMGGSATGRPQFDSIPVDAALDLAREGFTVLPLARAQNRPHPMLGRGWTQQSVGSRDADQIRSWWAVDPAANVGVVNGPRSGVLIVDVDRKPGKADGWATLLHHVEQRGQSWPATSWVLTPSGGMHFYFRLPDDTSVPVKSWLPGVETTWQVAAPPSCRIVSMRDSSMRDAEAVFIEYRWRAGLDAMTVAPPWLLEDIRTSPGLAYGGGSTGSSAGRLDGALPPTEWFVEHGLGHVSGSRNIDCHKLACRLWRVHWGHDDLVTSIIWQAWQSTNTTGFPWSEALACIASARRFVGPQVEAERSWIHELGKGQEA